MAATSTSNSAASADDWFASSPGAGAHGITPATAASSSRQQQQQQQQPTSGNSGFYSMTTINNNNTTGSGAIGSNDNIRGSSGNYRSTNNHYGNSQQQPYYGSGNLYGNNSNAAPTAPPAPSYGFTNGGYYGGNSGGYANDSYQHAMTGAIGGGIGGTVGGVNNNSSNVAIPPASAFGSHMNTNSSSSSSLYNDGGTNSYNDMSGTMGGPIGIAPTSLSSMPNVFDPNIAAAKKAEAMQQQQQQQQHYIAGGNNPSTVSYEEDYDSEPPLLEELGVNFPHIYSKSRAVLFPFGTHAKSLESGLIENDADLAGPLAFALGLGGELLLAGKLHFGFVYGFGLSGCIFMTLILNLLNPNGAVSMWTVVSILGYALLPVNLLACVNIFMRVHKLGVWGMVLAVLVIVWCTTASARLFERGCNMREQRFLVAYPTALLYSAFVIITIF